MAAPTTAGGFAALVPFAGTKTVAAAATPEALSAVDAYVVSALVYPASGSQGAFQIGDATHQYVDGPLTIGAPTWGVINLKDHFIKVAADGDAVNFLAYYRA